MNILDETTVDIRTITARQFDELEALVLCMAAEEAVDFLNKETRQPIEWCIWWVQYLCIIHPQSELAVTSLYRVLH